MSDSPFGIEHKQGDCYATWYVHRQAKALAGNYGIPADDADDISQDLFLLLLSRWPQFDPSISKATTFIQNIVDTRIDELIRERFSPKRDYRCERSMSEAAEYGQLDGVRGQPELSDQEHFELMIDCETVLESLPADLMRIAEMLKEMTPRAAAGVLGISETTLRRRLLELRERFAAAGYGESTNLNEED